MIKLVAGTRPEVIKLGPLARALREQGLQFSWCLIAQHKELLEIATKDLGLNEKPGISVDMIPSLTKRLGVILVQLEKHLAGAKYILVQGDTLSAFAGALFGFLEEIPVIHLEAGVRSHANEPFPEEHFRRFIDQVACLCFAPTLHTMRNLRQEGFADKTVYTFGNTVSDALKGIMLEEVVVPFKAYFLVALLRRENWPIIPRVYELLSKTEHLNFIVVIHPNHREAKSFLHGKHIFTLPPLPYHKFIALLKGADAVITDSGGTQEEASLLGVPAFILRRAIDRPESIELGQAKQVANYEQLIETIEESNLLEMAFPAGVYGDGRVGMRIATYMARILGEGKTNNLKKEAENGASSPIQSRSTSDRPKL